MHQTAQMVFNVGLEVSICRTTSIFFLISSEAAWLATFDRDRPLDSVLGPVCLSGVEVPLRASRNEGDDSMATDC